ncbi:MAG: RDD family protein [Flavobacteriales bacterium]|nr:RDD family protein [Flavobacteriales bacterium]
MKTIDIRTTQNVTITYELAGVQERILAFILDIVIKGLFTGLLAFVVAMMSSANENVMMAFMFLIVLPVNTFYTLAFEVLMNGQTPGKRMMKIKVIRMNGKQPVFYDHMIRWTFRILDVFLSGGVLATMLIVSTDNAQRLGDMTSNSTVVKINSRSVISLADILKIDTIQNYEPRFPGIRKFSESDILLIKETIERYQKYKNDAHKEAVIQLCNNISKKLDVGEHGMDKITFLKTLIKDYIVLTR